MQVLKVDVKMKQKKLYCSTTNHIVHPWCFHIVDFHPHQTTHNVVCAFQAFRLNTKRCAVRLLNCLHQALVQNMLVVASS